jgi:hypothetical protein
MPPRPPARGALQKSHVKPASNRAGMKSLQSSAAWYEINIESPSASKRTVAQCRTPGGRAGAADLKHS